MVIISYGTTEPVRYVKAAERLRKNVSVCGLKSDIEVISSKGSRKENTLMKPGFILNKMLEYKDETLVWLDVDSSLRNGRFSLEGNYDIGYIRSNRPGKASILGSTLVVKPTIKARDFIWKWFSLCCEDRKDHDHGRMLETFSLVGGRYNNVTEKFSGSLIINVGMKKEIKL